jgi:adenylate cyclase
MGVWAALGATAIATQTPFAQRIEGQAQAFLFALRGPMIPPEDIVILAIDEESLSQGDFYQSDPQRFPYLEPLQTWPWERSAYSTAIVRLAEAGAKVVALDVLLVSPSVYGDADDAQLQQTLQQYGDRVVLAAAFENSEATGGNLSQLLQPIYPAGAFLPGLINVEPDADQRLRQMPEITRQTLQDVSGIQTNIPTFPQAMLQQGNLTLPVDKGDEIYFYGGAHSFPEVPFWHVLEPKNWELHQRAGTFRDKWVLIGPTATSLQDIKRTPTSDTMPGVEVHAHTLATLMEGKVIATAIPNSIHRGILTGLLMVTVGWGLGYAIGRPLLRPLGFATAAIAWGAVAYLLFVLTYTWIPLAIPVSVLGAGGITYTAAGAFKDRREQQRMRRTLERYMAPPVVAEVLNQPENYRELIGGKELAAAVLFSDIRGFSRLSYHLPPAEMVALLNIYLDAMVQAIMDYRGTIDKFIGDAVMAEFGSPTSQGAKEDALNAIRAGLAMRRSLAELRQRFRAEGKPDLFHGIGISYGNLIAGNIGSAQRLEFTVIGDTVNVASRIESLTKKLGTDFLITAPLYELVQTEVQVIEMGSHRLSGREEELTQVYSVVGFDEADTHLYKQVHTALKAYLNH